MEQSSALSSALSSTDTEQSREWSGRQYSHSGRAPLKIGARVLLGHCYE